MRILQDGLCTILARQLCVRIVLHFLFVRYTSCNNSPRLTVLQDSSKNFIPSAKILQDFCIARWLMQETCTSCKKCVHLCNILLHGIPPMASSHLQRRAIMLSAYDYSILYRSGKDHANANLFSCLPLPVVEVNVPQPGDCILLFECLQVDPISKAVGARMYGVLMHM